MTAERIAELRQSFSWAITPVWRDAVNELLDAAESANALAVANERLIQERDAAKRDLGELVRLWWVHESTEIGSRDEVKAACEINEHIIGNGLTATPEPVIAQIVRERDTAKRNLAEIIRLWKKLRDTEQWGEPDTALTKAIDDLSDKAS